jgi:hypothetical protein
MHLGNDIFVDISLTLKNSTMSSVIRFSFILKDKHIKIRRKDKPVTEI